MPDHAALHETVNLAHRHDLGKQAGFINAVLRSAQREKDDWLARLAELRTSQPAIGHSHPQWLVQRWADRWPDHDTLLEWNNRPAPIYARRNTLRATADELEAQWICGRGPPSRRPNNPLAQPRPHVPFGNRRLPGRAAQLCRGQILFTGPQHARFRAGAGSARGENILDLCAAPGGKSTAIAQRMQDTGAILAVDIDERRLDRLRENAGRLGHTCIRPSCFRRSI